MGDVFKEQLVKRQKSAKDIAIKVSIIVLAVLIVLTFIFVIYLGPLIVILIFGLFFGVRYALSFFNVEYEYVFTNGELDIDIIYDQSRRKRVFSAKAKSFELMAHIDDRAHDHSLNMAQQTLDYSSGVPGPSTYVFLLAQDGKKIKVIIEPNEKMLKAFSVAVPRRSLYLRPGTVLLP